MTVADCDHLNKKHTIFGRVMGDTLFNLMTISELDTNNEDRPVGEKVPKILKFELIKSPFTDLQKKEDIKEEQVEQKKTS